MKGLVPESCRHCGEKDGMTWSADVINKSPIQNGRLTLHDVSPVFVLGCEYCSETIRIVDASEIAGVLNGEKG